MNREFSFLNAILVACYHPRFYLFGVRASSISLLNEPRSFWPRLDTMIFGIANNDISGLDKNAAARRDGNWLSHNSNARVSVRLSQSGFYLA